MNSGASLISPIVRASLVQSSSAHRALAHVLERTDASADSSRIMISILLISSEKITDAMPCLIEQLRAMSRADGGVVRRHHRAAGQVQVLRVVDHHAPDRDAGIGRTSTTNR